MEFNDRRPGMAPHEIASQQFDTAKGNVRKMDVGALRHVAEHHPDGLVRDLAAKDAGWRSQNKGASNYGRPRALLKKTDEQKASTASNKADNRDKLIQEEDRIRSIGSESEVNKILSSKGYHPHLSAARQRAKAVNTGKAQW